MWERSRVKRRRGVEDGDRRAASRRGGRLLDGSIQDGSVENRNRACNALRTCFGKAVPVGGYPGYMIRLISYKKSPR